MTITQGKPINPAVFVWGDQLLGILDRVDRDVSVQIAQRKTIPSGRARFLELKEREV